VTAEYDQTTPADEPPERTGLLPPRPFVPDTRRSGDAPQATESWFESPAPEAAPATDAAVDAPWPVQAEGTTYPWSPGAPTYQASTPPYQREPYPMQPTPVRRSRLATAAFVLVVGLLLVAGGQAYLLLRLDQRLDRAERAATETRKRNDVEVKALAARVEELERRAGKSLDSAAVAAEVSNSVFRVVAGDSSGTAFAFGKEPAGGGTDLLTNFHVVKDLYDAGAREVALERDNKRFTAKIVRAEPAPGKDMVLLHAAERFPRLQAAATAATPGQPVLVIGAPLGLTDTVTTGVVSALRTNADGPVLQFDAPINPGNSGGPVVDAQKKVVGIATAKAKSAEGIGLAIPIDVVCATFANC
jgi:S1-C subfamily serine protease